MGVGGTTSVSRVGRGGRKVRGSEERRSQRAKQSWEHSFLRRIVTSLTLIALYMKVEVSKS